MKSSASREIMHLICGLKDLSFIFLTCLQSKHYSCWSTSFSPIFGAGYHQLTCLGLWTSWLYFPAVPFLVPWPWPLIFFQGLSLSPLVFSSCMTVSNHRASRLTPGWLTPTSAQRFPFQLLTDYVLDLNPSCLLQDHPPPSIPSPCLLLAPSLSDSSSPSSQKHV